MSRSRERKTMEERERITRVQMEGGAEMRLRVMFGGRAGDMSERQQPSMDKLRHS